MKLECWLLVPPIINLINKVKVFGAISDMCLVANNSTIIILILELEEGGYTDHTIR